LWPAAPITDLQGGTPRCRSTLPRSAWHREAVGEPEGVVHVVDVPARDSECFSIFGGVSAKVSATSADAPGANRSQIPQEMADVALLLRVPARSLQLVGDPLHEESGIVVPLPIAKRRIHRGVHVPLDGGELRQASRLHLGEGLAHRRHHLALVGHRCMVLPNCPRSSEDR